MAGDFGKCSIFGAALLVLVIIYSAVKNVKKLLYNIKLVNYQLPNLAFKVKTNGCQPQAKFRAKICETLIKTIYMFLFAADFFHSLT